MNYGCAVLGIVMMEILIKRFVMIIDPRRGISM
jgi:hypothetical protein